jgi:hypothetical protein
MTDPECKTYCDRCGDCLDCYGQDACYDGGYHVQPEREKKLPDESAPEGVFP